MTIEHTEAPAPAASPPTAAPMPAAAPNPVNPQERAGEIRRIWELGADDAPRPGERNPRDPRDGIEARDWRVLPEKHRVMKEDGTLDAEATLFNIERQRVDLEKRFGSGDASRPAAPDGYKLELPERLKAMGDAALDETTVKAFQAEVHEQGFTQSQYSWIMEKYLDTASNLVNGTRAYDMNAAITELRQEWPVPADFDANVGRANTAIRGYAGEDAEGIFRDYGSDARIVRMMAKIGAEMGEDTVVANVQSVGLPDISTLQRSEAYTNPKHPDHAKVSAQVRQHYQAMDQLGRGNR